MINQNSINAVALSKLSKDFALPLYENYCFSNIPDLIKNIFGIQNNHRMPNDIFGTFPRQYDKVILLIVDAFGWYFFERYKEQFPFLQRILNQGVVSKLTSQFPSTTACHMTTIHTGLPVGESGVFEWFYYEPLVDEVIAPLLFSFAGDAKRETLQQRGYAPETLFPRRTLYNDLNQNGIPSHIFQHADYTPSSFSNVVFQGGIVNRYYTFSKALDTLCDRVSKTITKSYFFLYLDVFDAACHLHGPDSLELDHTAEVIFSTLEKAFFQKHSKNLKNTLLILTADHGQVKIDPATTKYVNQEIPTIERYLKQNSKRKPIIFGGSPRDMFLYIKEERLAEAKEILEANLRGIAEIWDTRQLIEKKIFGSSMPCQTLLERLGNLVILPYNGQSVWWYEKGRFENTFRGHHGGLTREELEIPFLVLPLEAVL